MQTQRQIPDPASIWWGPLFRGYAAEVAPQFPVWRPQARVRAAVSLFVASLFITLLAPGAWGLAHRELARIERGECSERGKGTLQIVLFGSVFLTFWLCTCLALLVAL